MTDIQNQVIEIICKYSAVDPTDMTAETRLEDINVVSLDVVEIIFDIEERFEIEIPTNPDASTRLEFSTIGEIVEGVKSILDKPRAS
jgi:acyl carrier protein